MVLYKTIAAIDINSFNENLEEELRNDWHVAGELIVLPQENRSGYGMQYTILLSKVE